MSGSGKCPQCGAQLMVDMKDGEHVLRCTSCDYYETMQVAEKSVAVGADIVSCEEAIAAIAQFNGPVIMIEKFKEEAQELHAAVVGGDPVDHITEEVADVLLMLKQIKIFYSISDKDVDKIVKHKIMRTLERNGIL